MILIDKILNSSGRISKEDMAGVCKARKYFKMGCTNCIYQPICDGKGHVVDTKLVTYKRWLKDNLQKIEE